MDLIDRERAINKLEDLITARQGWLSNGTAEIRGIDAAICELVALPSARKTSKWLKTGQSFIDPRKFRNFFCPICGLELDQHIRVAPNYCPNCGARMVEE